MRSDGYSIVYTNIASSTGTNLLCTKFKKRFCAICFENISLGKTLIKNKLTLLTMSIKSLWRTKRRKCKSRNKIINLFNINSYLLSSIV